MVKTLIGVTATVIIGATAIGTTIVIVTIVVTAITIAIVTTGAMIVTGAMVATTHMARPQTRAIRMGSIRARATRKGDKTTIRKDLTFIATAAAMAATTDTAILRRIAVASCAVTRKAIHVMVVAGTMDDTTTVGRFPGN